MKTFLLKEPNRIILENLIINMSHVTGILNKTLKSHLGIEIGLSNLFYAIEISIQRPYTSTKH